MKFKKLVLPLAILSVGLSFLAHAESAHRSKAKHKPPEPDLDMLEVLDTLDGLGGKSIADLSPEEARRQPTPKDAVLKLLESQGQPVNPEPVASIQHLKIPGPSGEISLNVYTPTGHGPFPVIVYFHGGGFVIADTKVYDASVRALANGTEAVVVSVDYHLAPEYQFPSQPNEAYAAFKWVVENAGQINGDPQRVAVAGESAGGNLATVVSLMARDHKETMPVHQLLIYPVVDNQMTNESYLRNENAKPLNPLMMNWFFNHYVKQLSDANNPYALPSRASTLQGLPPTTVITAEIDPLYSEGQAFVKRLAADGVPVSHRHYDGVTHEFFGMGAVLSKAKDAQTFASGELMKTFLAT